MGELHLSGAVDIHGENLVALQVIAGGLENEFLAVDGKVSFGILPAKGELADVVEMFLLAW